MRGDERGDDRRYLLRRIFVLRNEMKGDGQVAKGEGRRRKVNSL